MPRKYTIKRRYSNRPKYSVEHTTFSATLNATTPQSATIIVGPTTTEGMRKVKHLTINISTSLLGSASSADVYWALVYVPDGYTANPMTLATGSSLYEPSQFVMNCGIFEATAGPNRLYSPLSRNLNEGDSIYLILAREPDATSQVVVQGVVNYAITFD